MVEHDGGPGGPEELDPSIIDKFNDGMEALGLKRLDPGFVSGFITDAVTIFGLDAADILPEKSLGEDLDVDSLDAVEFSMAVEERLKIEITEDELKELTIVGVAAEMINAKLNPEDNGADGGVREAADPTADTPAGVAEANLSESDPVPAD